MRSLLLVIIIQSATNDVGSFDLPKPLNNFYDEVVRFYKRVRTEGGKKFFIYSLAYFLSKFIFFHDDLYTVIQ